MFVTDLYLSDDEKAFQATDYHEATTRNSAGS
jgi:hypothetical protein